MKRGLARYDCGGGILGGRLPFAALWEKLGLLALVDQWLTVKRQPDSLSDRQFVSTVLMLFLGFSRVDQVRYARQDEMVQKGELGARGYCRSKTRIGGFWTRCIPTMKGN